LGDRSEERLAVEDRWILASAFLAKRIAPQRLFFRQSFVFFVTLRAARNKPNRTQTQNDQEKYEKALTFIVITSYRGSGPGSVGQCHSPRQCTGLGEFKELQRFSRCEYRNRLPSLSRLEQSDSRRGARSGRIRSAQFVVPPIPNTRAISPAVRAIPGTSGRCAVVVKESGLYVELYADE
jgi:hypothetical protein